MATARYDLVVSDVLKALENPKYRWRTVGSVAVDTGLTPDTVRQVLSNLPGDTVVRTPSQKGLLYTTRTHYNETRTFLSRLLSVVSDMPK